MKKIFIVYGHYNDASFNAAIKKYGVSSPDELDDEKKKDFFNYVDKNWSGDNEAD